MKVISQRKTSLPLHKNLLIVFHLTELLFQLIQSQLVPHFLLFELLYEMVGVVITPYSLIVQRSQSAIDLWQAKNTGNTWAKEKKKSIVQLIPENIY